MINAPPEKEFVFHDGSRTKNLTELYSKIDKLSDQQFSEFANSQKNDFANWVEYVLMDKNLSDRMRRASSRVDSLYVIKDRIGELEAQDSITRLSKKHANQEKTHQEKREEHLETSTKEMMPKPGQQVAKQEDMSAEERKLWDIIFNLFKKKETVASEANIDLRSPAKESLENTSHHEQMTRHETHAHPIHEPAAVEKDTEKNSVLWTVIYVVLILLILGLLAYKLLA